MSEVGGDIGISLPNNQCQHRTLHIQKDVLPYELFLLLCPVSAALASIFRMRGNHSPLRGEAADVEGEGFAGEGAEGLRLAFHLRQKIMLSASISKVDTR